MISCLSNWMLIELDMIGITISNACIDPEHPLNPNLLNSPLVLA